MNSETMRLILLPGLGADYRLLEPQQKAFPQLIVPRWLEPRPGETLPQYAQRMAERIGPLVDRPLILGGVSFGGMLACEMARHLRPRAVVLIASCRGPDGLRPVYQLGKRLLPLLPARTWNIAKILASPVMRCFCLLPAELREELVTMFRETDAAFMHWVLGAMLHWASMPSIGSPVFQIHGRRDPLIPVCRVEADRIITDGGHLINCTHAEQVNAFIRKVMD